MTAHKHADLMAQYAKDAMKTDKPWELWEINATDNEKAESGWVPMSRRGFFNNDSLDYRRKPDADRLIDPYYDLRQAEKAGKTIQAWNDSEWVDQHSPCGFIMESKFYRVKEGVPKTKTLYKWAYLHYTSESWVESDRWLESEEDFEQDMGGFALDCKRLDYTAIEVPS